LFLLEQPKLNHQLLFFSLAFLLLMAYDTFSRYRLHNDSYWSGDVSDLLFFLSSVFLVLGMGSLQNINLQNNLG
jgi:TRAP-type C4-dicarboxylate transport system permease small subunit